MAKTTIYLLILTLVAPWLYDRYLSLSALASNRPSKFREIYNIKSHDIRFQDRLKNCEDVVLDEDRGLAFLSCTPGRDRWNTVMGTFAPEKGLATGQLWVLHYANLSNEAALTPLQLLNFTQTANFQPLGMDYDPQTSHLYVVNHAPTGSVIETFYISPTLLTATHIQTLQHPLLHTPNSIHALGNHKLFISNDHFIRAAVSPLLSKIETFAGAPGGTVVLVDTQNPMTARIAARVPYANGLAMLKDSKTLAVASSSLSGVYFFDVSPSFSLKRRRYIRTPVAVDNISVDGRGTLLLAGHPFVLTLMQVSAARPRCDPESEDPDDRKACECWAPSWAAEWSEAAGLRELYKGHGYCSSSTVVRDVGKGVGIMSGLYASGLMFFRE